jgi:hypothetical protein
MHSTFVISHWSFIIGHSFVRSASSPTGPSTVLVFRVVLVDALVLQLENADEFADCGRRFFQRGFFLGRELDLDDLFDPFGA